jgi:hypothetical protein
MSLMDNMMRAMIRNMSVKEKEEMMLTMMPEMMKKVDPKIMMPNMLKEVGQMITLYGVYEFISKLLKEAELKKALGEKLNALKEQMPSMLSKMRPMIIDMMKGFMPKMMSTMKPMMEGMMKDGCFMKEIVKDKPEMKQNMGNMMSKMCPDMAGEVIPDEKRKQFVKDIYNNVITKNGIEMDAKELTK